MITELTAKQIAKFPYYVEKWTKRGLTTQQQTLENAKRDFERFQRLVLQREPAPVVLLNSPEECIAAALNCVGGDRKQAGSQVASQVYSQAESQFWSQVASQVGSQVGSEVRSQVVSRVESRVESQVWSEVRSQVGSQVWSQADLNIYPYFDCQFWASWFAYYEFMRVELGIKYPNREVYDAIVACHKYGMVYPMEKLCIVCQPPTVIKKNDLGLHCEDGPALSYAGKNEIYALNGVAMKKEWVMIPADQIPAQEIPKETNADVRRELLRKVGMVRLFNQLSNKMLDKQGDYELYSMDIGQDLKNCKFLKMKNPSLENTFHLEGVDETVETVSAALMWRNQGWFEQAEVLS